MNIKKDLYGNELEVGKLYILKPLPHTHHYPLFLLDYQGHIIVEMPKNSAVLLLDPTSWERYFSKILFKDKIGYIEHLNVEFVKLQSPTRL